MFPLLMFDYYLCMVCADFPSITVAFYLYSDIEDILYGWKKFTYTLTCKHENW